MRSLSLNFRKELFAQESGKVAALLLTITHPDLVDPIRISTDPTERITIEPLRYGTVSRGETYYFVAAEVHLPDEVEKSPPTSRLMIENVTRELVPLARSVTSPPSVKIEGIVAAAPDTIEFEVPALDMVNLSYDAGYLTFDLVMDALANEACPAGSFDPASFPGLFS